MVCFEIKKREERDRTQHAGVSEVSFYPMLAIQFPNTKFIYYKLVTALLNIYNTNSNILVIKVFYLPDAFR